MNTDSPDRLSEIETAWGPIEDAHAGRIDLVEPAREKLLARYRKAVFGYLCGCTRDPDRAEDLSQEFWLKFLQGAFRHADPGTGSFRKYVKAALSHMVSRDDAKRRRAGAALDTDPPDVAAPPSFDEDGRAFQERWQQAVLNDCWERLVKGELPGSVPLCAVLRAKAEFPDRPDQELAGVVAERTGRPISHANFRKILQRAREQFAELVYQVVAESLRDPTSDRIADELAQLGLLRYCRSAVAKRSDMKA